jgi:hypothetical protein
VPECRDPVFCNAHFYENEPKMLAFIPIRAQRCRDWLVLKELILEVVSENRVCVEIHEKEAIIFSKI